MFLISIWPLSIPKMSGKSLVTAYPAYISFEEV